MSAYARLHNIAIRLTGAVVRPLTLRARRACEMIHGTVLDSPRLRETSHVSIIMTPAPREVRGGTLQILNLFHAMMEIRASTGVEPILCWLPGHGRHQHHLAGTGSEAIVVPLEAALTRFSDTASVTLHVPEFASGAVASNTTLWGALTERHVAVNVLNLNHHALPGRRVFNELKSRCRRVTMTADIWATPAYEQVFGVRVHWIPVWIWPTDIKRVPFAEKRDVMILSPDGLGRPNRERIINVVRSKFRGLEMITVSRMPFSSYCELESIAKWSITFGEGHDGYFMGPAMRGGIPFAVFNDTFVGWNQSEWRTLYSDYDDMASRIADDLDSLDHEDAYDQYSAQLYAKYRTRGVLSVMRRQVSRFHAETFDYYPGPLWRPEEFVTA